MNISREYKICSKTIMDTTDRRITFDENDVSDHALNFYKNVKPNWELLQNDSSGLNKIIDKIKKDGKGRDFDCIIGLSGGLDSSYMLHIIVNEFQLRPLVFHVDGGWNSEIAVHNIKVLIDKLNLDLFTEVINWEEMRDFQLAYFKSGLPNLDIPQDHAFIATLYNFANKYKVKYILNGGNISTECVRNPLEYFYYGTDMLQIFDIKRKYCNTRMKTYPFSSIFRHKIYLKYFKRINVFKPLNYISYIKKDAIKLLKKNYNWKDYPQKHFESRFTRFYEGYWLPKRFNFDTRKVQLSSLILTNQITREEALEMIDQPVFDSLTEKNELNFVSNKLEINLDELMHYFNMPRKYYWDYLNQEILFNLGAKFLNRFGSEFSIKR